MDALVRSSFLRDLPIFLLHPLVILCIGDHHSYLSILQRKAQPQIIAPSPFGDASRATRGLRSTEGGEGFDDVR